MSALFTPLAGQELTAANLAQLIPVTAVKLSDVAQVTSTTLVNDAALFIPVAANAIYEVSMFIIYTQGTVGLLNMGFTGPTAATFDWTAVGLAASVTGADNGSYVSQARTIADTRMVGGFTTNCTCRIEGRLVTSSTSGTLNFQWAQSVGSATGTTVKKGSFMIARQIG